MFGKQREKKWFYFLEHCNGPLGMESGSISDEDLSASSSHDISSVGPQMAR